MDEVARRLIEIARYLAIKSPSQALEAYLNAFVKFPDLREHMEHEFRDFLTKLNGELATVGRKEEIFTNFERAIHIFPGDVKLLNDIGKYLCKYGFYGEAMCHFERALQIDPSQVGIEKSLNNTKSVVFPQTQFSPFNDVSCWDERGLCERGGVGVRARYRVAGVQCSRLAARYRLRPAGRALLAVPALHAHAAPHPALSYCAEDIARFDDLIYVTDPYTLFEVDFRSNSDVCEKIRRTEPYTARLTTRRAGRLDCLVGWFDVQLGDDVTITTDPRRVSSRQQAVFFDVLPRDVINNDVTTVQFYTFMGKLFTVPELHIHRISPETLKFLNDVEYLQVIESCISSVCVYLGQIEDPSYLDLVDLNPFPFFGLLMLKRGVQSLVCYARTRDDKIFLETVFRANDVPLSKVTVLVGEIWSREVFEGRKFHAVFCPFIDLHGDLDLSRKKVALHLKQGHMVEGGLFLPAQTEMIAQLVNCQELDKSNDILHSVVGGLNRQRLSQAAYVELARLQYTSLAAPLSVAQCALNIKSSIYRVPIASDGECNSVLCWFRIHLIEGGPDISTNRADSFVEGTAFLLDEPLRLFCGDVATILRCVDPEGSFKLTVDVEPF